MCSMSSREAYQYLYKYISIVTNQINTYQSRFACSCCQYCIDSCHYAYWYTSIASNHTVKRQWRLVRSWCRPYRFASIPGLIFINTHIHKHELRLCISISYGVTNATSIDACQSCTDTYRICIDTHIHKHKLRLSISIQTCSQLLYTLQI